MLQVRADVRSVDAVCIVAVSAFDMMRLKQRLAQVATDQILVSDFRTDCRASNTPIKITIYFQTIYIATVIIILHDFWSIVIAFVSVVVLVPIDGWLQMQTSLFVLSLQRCYDLGGVLVLLVGLPLRCSIK